MFLKNLIVYTINDNSSIKQLTNDTLKQIAFTPCGPVDYVKSGFVSPIGDDEVLMLSIRDHSLMTVRTESKILPNSVINKKLAEKVKPYEQTLQRKVTKQEKLSLKDELMADLLSKAFTRDAYTNIWINHRDNFIAVSSSSFKRAEDVLAILRKEIGSLSITPLSSDQPVATIFKQWLRDDKAANNFVIHNDAVLVEPLDNGKIKLIKENLTADEVKNYLDSGREVESLSFAYDGRTTFTINTNLVFSKIAYSSEILDQNEDIPSDEKVKRIEADFYLVANELSNLIKNLMKSINHGKE